MGDIECDHCGGAEFYKEAGYFFCKGCQLQSQEVQEYVFDDSAVANTSKAKKVHTAKSKQKDNKITSWECYNYILLGLTEELINLGADRKLKSVVKLLWLRYLEKLYVFQRGKDELPRLQAVGSGMDAEIVYGKLAKKKRKRRKSSSSEVDVTTLDSSSLTQERIKRKRALIKAHYEDYSQKSQGTSSLHNETLTSLHTGSEKSSKGTAISYNIYATRELKRMKNSRRHWRKHRIDFEHELKCHKLSYRTVSKKYRESPYIISLNKIYSILYIGLLIVKDKIQLGDLLRFVREGNLSFNCYSHFFPEEFSDKVLNFRNFKKIGFFTNTPFRKVTAELVTFLKVEGYISRPDLIDLCDRYCREMNLPQGICNCAKNIISRSDIKMSFRKIDDKVPNYEGRVLSIILFVIKLLFGLDDVTEFHLGAYSEILNKSDAVDPKMFNIVNWLKHIEYRSIVMTNQHFPTSFVNDTNIRNPELPLGVLAKKEYPAETKLNSNKDNYKQLLEKLKNELTEPSSIEFPVTLTPFLDYTRLLPKANYLKILSKDFCRDSLVHILRPIKFLNIINNDTEPEIINRGANDNWVIENVLCPKRERKQEHHENRKLVTAKLTFDKPTTGNDVKENEMSDYRLKDDFHMLNKSKFLHNLVRLNRDSQSRITHLDLDQIRKDLINLPDVYSEHYNPYERFWMRNRMRLEILNHKEFKRFFEKFPYNFRLVFNECQRIAQQTEQELLLEYQHTELHLVYFCKYSKGCSEKMIKENLICKYLDARKNFW